MKKYKHYSFDLWNTIITPNHEFKNELAKHFHYKYNPHQMPIEEVVEIIKEVDLECKTINSIVGSSTSPNEMYCRVLYKLKFIRNMKKKDLAIMLKETEEIFLRYQPYIYSDDTVPILKQLKKNGSTLSVLSNTGYTMGKTILKFLDDTKILKLFDFHIYTGDVDISKTNENIFIMLKNDAYKLHSKHGSIQADEILHVGNDPIADAEAPRTAGIDCFIINSNNKTIKDVL